MNPSDAKPDDHAFAKARTTTDIARWLLRKPGANIPFVAQEVADRWEAADGGDLAASITLAFDGCGPVDDWKDDSAEVLLSCQLDKHIRRIGPMQLTVEQVECMQAIDGTHKHRLILPCPADVVRQAAPLIRAGLVKTDHELERGCAQLSLTDAGRRALVAASTR